MIEFAGGARQFERPSQVVRSGFDDRGPAAREDRASSRDDSSRDAPPPSVRFSAVFMLFCTTFMLFCAVFYCFCAKGDEFVERPRETCRIDLALRRIAL